MCLKHLFPIYLCDVYISRISFLFEVLQLSYHLHDFKILINEDKVCSLLTLFLLKHKCKDSFIVDELYIYSYVTTCKLFVHFLFNKHERVLYLMLREVEIRVVFETRDYNILNIFGLHLKPRIPQKT